MCRCITFYDVTELSSLYHPERVLIWDILSFHFISESKNGKKKKLCYYIYEFMVFLKVMT